MKFSNNCVHSQRIRIQDPEQGRNKYENSDVLEPMIEQDRGNRVLNEAPQRHRTRGRIQLLPHDKSMFAS